LTDSGDSTLHFHYSDRARANHTGTQTASTISDFNTAALTAAPAETTTTTGALINGAASKTTPVDADHVGIMDSEASNILKKLSWANVKATLKTYFDTLYVHLTGDQSVDGIKTFNNGIRLGDGTAASVFSMTAPSSSAAPDPYFDILQFEEVTSGASATVIASIPISVMAGFEIFVTAWDATNSHGASYKRYVSCKLLAGVATIVGALATTYTAEDDAAWNVTITTSTTRLVINVAGGAGDTVNWNMRIVRSTVS
jgi:hypothetical protein